MNKYFYCFFFQQEEEINTLQKRIQQLENDLDQAQENLANAQTKLEASEKAQTEVRVKKYTKINKNK